MEELLAPEPIISDSDIGPAPAPVVVVAHMNQAPTVIQIDAAFVEVAPVEAALVEAARVEAATAEAVPISNAENEGDNPAATDDDDADTSADENSNDTG